MAGRIELVLGDMFNGPSDLIVLPCSTAGTMTRSVRSRLEALQLPNPGSRMELGQVIFIPLGGNEQLSRTAAYAASVEGYTSSVQAISTIATTVADFARRNVWVKLINAPLLGSGAGGLAPEATAKAMQGGFLSNAPDHVTLRIHVLEEKLYRTLMGLFKGEEAHFAKSKEEASELACRTIRVLVSYVHGESWHTEWVRQLATKLRDNGIDARLDQWDLSPGMDLPQWMCNELDLADRVLLVCDEAYARKADGRHGGVGWESRLVQGDLLHCQQSNPDKYVPIVRSERVEDGTPHFLRGAYCIHWPGNDWTRCGDRLDAIVKTIYRVSQRPPLGRPPAYTLAA